MSKRESCWFFRPSFGKLIVHFGNFVWSEWGFSALCETMENMFSIYCCAKCIEHGIRWSIWLSPRVLQLKYELVASRFFFAIAAALAPDAIAASSISYDLFGRNIINRSVRRCAALCRVANVYEKFMLLLGFICEIRPVTRTYDFFLSRIQIVPILCIGIFDRNCCRWCWAWRGVPMCIPSPSHWWQRISENDGLNLMFHSPSFLPQRTTSARYLCYEYNENGAILEFSLLEYPRHVCCFTGVKCIIIFGTHIE